MAEFTRESITEYFDSLLKTKLKDYEKSMGCVNDMETTYDIYTCNKPHGHIIWVWGWLIRVFPACIPEGTDLSLRLKDIDLINITDDGYMSIITKDESGTFAFRLYDEDES